ncbi:hypothetical protein SHKM778_22230 [Streptomyces sp. KM77-8]|uniref:EccD-like transmembrane domain-containing protein n=1 Tax=Streptomyces haneummycinicus TaxID=3074435 RepID=A0AAT9HEU2_9ACTN
MVAPDSRIDVALPVDIPVADVHPEILRLTGQTQPAGAPTGYHLVRRDGRVLDGARTLADERILDGDVLSLRPFAQSLPPAVHDDVPDAVASAVVRDRHLWSDDLLRAAGLTAGALLLLLLAFLLWFADPVRHDMHGLPGVIAGGVGLLLLAFAGIRARVYGDRVPAVALGLGALPLLLVAGSGIIAAPDGQGPGRLQFMLGCAAVLVASVTLLALAPGSDAPFVAATFVAAVGTLATFLVIVTESPARDAAAVCAPARSAWSRSCRACPRVSRDCPSATRPRGPPSPTNSTPTRPRHRTPRPWTPNASPPRPGAATNSCWASSAAPRPSSSRRPRSWASRTMCGAGCWRSPSAWPC